MGIKIKPLKKKDLKFFNAIRNSAREFLHDNREFTLEQTKEWFESLPPEKKYYLISATKFHEGDTKFSEPIPIGYFRVREYSPTCWEVGADLHEDYRGMGLAKKAYKKLFKKFPDVTSWCLEVLGNNTRAYTLYRSLGFEISNDVVVDEVIRGRERIPSISMHKGV